MSDLVKRLRDAHPNSPQYVNGSHILAEAADRIERLEAFVEKVREARKVWDTPGHWGDLGLRGKCAALECSRDVELALAALDSSPKNK